MFFLCSTNMLTSKKQSLYFAQRGCLEKKSQIRSQSKWDKMNKYVGVAGYFNYNF